MRLLLLLLFMSFSANSAEFVLNGKVVRTTVQVNEARCAGYSVLVKEDRFPREFEDRVPESVALNGFFGSDLIVGAAAFVKKGAVERKVPVSVKNYQKAGLLLDDGRVYLPSSGYCLDDQSFLLAVWSGGNCKRCEMLVKFQIGRDGSVAQVGVPSQVELDRALKRKD